MLIVQTDRIIELYHDLSAAMIYFTNKTMQTMKIVKLRTYYHRARFPICAISTILLIFFLLLLFFCFTTVADFFPIDNYICQ